MKMSILLGLLIFGCNVLGQQTSFVDKILLFRNTSPFADSCICDKDMSDHEYYFVDQNNYIHYVRDGLGKEEVAYKFDTSYVGDKQVIKPVEYLRPHDVLSIFKFKKLKDRLFLVTKIDSGAYVEELFYDFNTGKSACTKSPFASAHSKLVPQGISLLKMDSVIVFNDHVFHCWCFQQKLPSHEIVICIDKVSLMPLAYEIKGIRIQGEIVDGGLYHEKFSIWGILELGHESIKKINIWKDPY